MNKKGVIESLSPLVTGTVIFALTIVIVFLVLSQVAANTTVAADANASAAIDTTQDALDDVPGWLPIIIVTVIGALLIGLVSLIRRR